MKKYDATLIIRKQTSVSRSIATTLSVALLGTLATGCVEAFGVDLSGMSDAIYVEEGVDGDDGGGRDEEGVAEGGAGGGEHTPSSCFGDLKPAEFEFPRDAESCDGPGFVRWSPEQSVWVGVISCGDGAVRLYLSEKEEGPFFPALDTAGHGQDQCELLAPGFFLTHEDDVTSGACASCSTGPNLPLEDVSGFQRSALGEPFEFVEKTGVWASQASRLNCGCALPTIE